VKDLPGSRSLLESIEAYPWFVDTKYYTADVQLCTTKSRTIGDQKFAETVEAFIAYFDSSQIDSFNQAKMWLPYLQEISPSVQILVCDQFHASSAVSRLAAIQWCLEHEFEMVELNPIDNCSSDDDDDELEDHFKETLGVNRIIEALSCHSWSNMVLKETPTFRSPYFQQLMNTARENKLESTKSSEPQIPTLQNDTLETTQLSRATDCKKEIHQEDTPSVEFGQFLSSADALASQCVLSETPSTNLNLVKSFDAGSIVSDNELHQKQTDMHGATSSMSTSSKDTTTMTSDSSKTCHKLGSERNQIIDGLIEGLDQADEGGEETFEKLFEKLQFMKESAGSMSAEQRRKYAEQVTLQFWQAIGGDDDEINGLSDEHENN
jgi:hypothetical protein